jgi:hypothetical protein
MPNLHRRPPQVTVFGITLSVLSPDATVVLVLVLVLVLVQNVRVRVLCERSWEGDDRGELHQTRVGG